MSIYFFKKSKRVEFLEKFDINLNDAIPFFEAKAKVNWDGVKYLEVVKSPNLCSAADTHMESGSCVFAIADDDERAEKFIKDNNWIDLVKDAAKSYPAAQFYFVELQRKNREGYKKSFDKCLKRMQQHYPDYQFNQIDWE